MTADERHELAAAIADELESRGSVDGTRMLDLVRAESQLTDALRVVRQEIDRIVRSSERLAAIGDG